MWQKTLFSLSMLLFVSATPVTLAQPADENDLVAGNSAFAFDLYRAMNADAGANVLVSPYSISQALAMTYAGAGGETAAQMAETLHFTLPSEELHEAFGVLNSDLLSRGNAVAESNDIVQSTQELLIANALWGEQTYPFNQAFLDQLAQPYGAGLQLTDFIGDPESARQAINDWVADQTEGHIQDIVPEGVITALTRLVLANAIYFSGAWLIPFDPESTADDDFTSIDDSTVTVPFMAQETHLPYARGDGYQVVSFPYANTGFEFTVILPDEGKFDVVEQTLDVTILDKSAETGVIVYLPKFSFTFDAALVPTLEAMGITDAFDPNLADFSGMTADPAADPLFISEVLHKAFIRIDETGTEAAAATTISMGAGSAQVATKPPPVEVRIDRPFIFLIRDTQTGAIIFLGRVMNPE